MSESTSDSENCTAREARDRGLTIAWPTLSTALGVIAVACLGALSVVATVREADVLATVALALAVISFAAQVVVSLSQSRAAAQQLAQAERTHNETRSLLSEVSTRASALLANQSQQFDRVLDAALDPSAIMRAIQEATPGGTTDESDQTPPGVPPASPDPAELSSNLVTAIRDEFRRASAARVDWGLASARPQPDRTYGLVSDALTYPDEEEGRPAFVDLMSLTPIEAALLTRRAIEDLKRAKEGKPPRGFLAADSPKTAAAIRLEELGLFAFAEGVSLSGRRGMWRRVTARGWLVARVTIADGRAPEWLREARGDNAAGPSATRP